MSDVKENFIELSNKESEKELYNVSIKLSNFKNEEDSELLQGQFNISISIRDEYLDNCEINKEMIKFRFLIEDSNCNILINNEELDVNVFTLSNCGKIKYTKKDYKKFSNLMGIIDKVLYISKIKKINIKYDIDEIKNENELISYEYGYKEQANRMLMIGILDKNYTPQSLMMIGYNDARDSHIIFNDLPETIRNCPEYLEGYRRGLEEEQTKSKHR